MEKPKKAKKDTSQKKGRKRISLRRKLVLIMLPVVIISFCITFLVTLSNTKGILQSNAKEQMELCTSSVNYEIAAEVNQVLGVMENVKTSIEKNCETEEDIKNYIYGVADAYPEIIPAGIYCGLCSGTYIDKLWTPDADWVMTERPWYQEGLSCDKVTFGEMYLDANTDQYIISAFSNIKNRSGNVVGVVCADIALDGLKDILMNSKVFEQGYVYAIDQVTGMVIGNSKEEAQNGGLLSEFDDAYSKQIVSMMEDASYDKVIFFEDEYICLSEVPNSNFVTVCRASKSDVESDLDGIQKSSLLTAAFGIVFLSVVIFIASSVFLNPVNGIMRVIDKMHDLDLTERAKAKSNDEFGAIAKNINQFADNLHGVMGQMKDAITEIDGKADMNAGIATSMSEMAAQQSDALSQLSQLMADLSASIHDIAEGTTSLTGHVVDTNTATTLVEKKVDETLQFITNGRDEMDHMTETMTVISTNSSELQEAVCDVEEGLHGINAMVNVINDIADQTSLLALNASIEAARAGEAGKGFAVVAEQIRTLADDCADSVEDIVKTTKKMEELVNIVTEKTATSMARIQDGNQMVIRTDETFHRINTVMQEINEAIVHIGNTLTDIEQVATDMAASTEEQSANTVGVLNDCEEAMHIAKRFQSEGEEMAVAGQQLKVLSGELSAKVERFKVD